MISFYFRLNILNQLIQQNKTFLTPSISQQLLKIFTKYAENPLKAVTFKQIRISCSFILEYFPESFNEDWRPFSAAVISDNSSSDIDLIYEKQLLLQMLIRYQKLTSTECLNLLQLFFNNKAMKRNEVIQTILTIFENCQKLNIPKSIELTNQIVAWLYTESNISGDTINVAPIKSDLVARLAVNICVNMLDPLKVPMKCENQKNHLTKCLSLKFNSTFLCLERHAKDLEILKAESELMEVSTKNCLIQLNYEKLMRTVNFEPVENRVQKNLYYLKIFIVLFEQFQEAKIFNAMNSNSCPLTKRIGFFLNHIQLQLNNEKDDSIDLLKTLDQILRKLNGNSVLSLILKTHDLDGFVRFIQNSISISERNSIEEGNHEKLLCLKVCAGLCVTEDQYGKVFRYIRENKFNIKEDIKDLMDIIEVSFFY